MSNHLILASASPRRRDLLTQAGLAFTVAVPMVDETPLAGEGAAAYVERIAIEKAQAIFTQAKDERQASQGQAIGRLVVLAADTTVVLTDGTILGKPLDAQDATRMLMLLSGRTHAVMTGVAAVGSSASGVRTASDVEITQVTFNMLSGAEIEAYVATGEPLDKAGAYAIQGYAARWIPRIEGDYFNVVGLPIARVISLLDDVG